MSDLKFHVVTDSDDDSRWTPVVDAHEGHVAFGSYPTPGAAVDAVQRWATGRGFKLCYFTLELRRPAEDRKPPAHAGWGHM